MALFDIEFLEEWSYTCGYLLMICYDMSTSIHFVISANRFLAVFTPLLYHNVFRFLINWCASGSRRDGVCTLVFFCDGVFTVVARPACASFDESISQTTFLLVTVCSFTWGPKLVQDTEYAFIFSSILWLSVHSFDGDIEILEEWSYICGYLLMICYNMSISIHFVISANRFLAVFTPILYHKSISQTTFLLVTVSSFMWGPKLVPDTEYAFIFSSILWLSVLSFDGVFALIFNVKMPKRPVSLCEM
uniref:7TM GPCR serpentine receptor class x (Srx) domain-containing protein n=1 Tax=Caenorhabditis japonica TaxID=281687 RepID=A0A8R1DWR7_CAEJA